MALLRIKSLEQVRYWDPGELGRTIGLDRIPEVRTLREKVQVIAESGEPAQWSKALAKDWMESQNDSVGVFYIDGHVRVYHGRQTKLPKRYISRERLCLRGTSDYWVNDCLGRPFFVVSKAVDDGLLHTLKNDIIPQLLADSPIPAGFEENPLIPRFEILFDREGYSPQFMKTVWMEHRIACTTYHKHPKDSWPEADFKTVEVTHPNGEVADMELAERRTYFKSMDFEMREVRRLAGKGHQTSILSTNFLSSMIETAPRMFARWSQENFFKYMMQHFGIDKLVDYNLEAISETTQVVNPAYRQLDNKLRSLSQKLSREKLKYGTLHLENEISPAHVESYVRKKAEIKSSVDGLEDIIKALKQERKDTKKHIPFGTLEKQDQFCALKKGTKQFVDVIKMIAYRAETAMASLLAPQLSKKDEARAIVRQIFQTDADLKPDTENATLTVRIHTLSNPRNNRYAKSLCEHLNASEMVFPGTNLRLVYDLVSS